MAVDVAHRVHERRLLQMHVRGTPTTRFQSILRRRPRPSACRRRRPQRCRLVGGDRQRQRLGRAAHREQEPAALDVLPDLLGDRLLERRDVREAELLCRSPVPARAVRRTTARRGMPRYSLFSWPVKSSWCRCNQSYFTRSPFMTSSSHTAVYSMPAYLSASVTASSHGGDFGRRVDRDLRRPLERDRVHVAARRSRRESRRGRPLFDRLDGRSPSSVAFRRAPAVGQQERAAAVVEEPLGLDPRR